MHGGEGLAARYCCLVLYFLWHARLKKMGEEAATALVSVKDEASFKAVMPGFYDNNCGGLALARLAHGLQASRSALLLSSQMAGRGG